MQRGRLCRSWEPSISFTSSWTWSDLIGVHATAKKWADLVFWGRARRKMKTDDVESLGYQGMLHVPSTYSDTGVDRKVTHASIESGCAKREGRLLISEKRMKSSKGRSEEYVQQPRTHLWGVPADLRIWVCRNQAACSSCSGSSPLVFRWNWMDSDGIRWNCRSHLLPFCL